MSVDATACTLRVARENPAAAEAQNKSYAGALEFKHTAFRYMRAPDYTEVAVEDILRGHINKGFFLLPVDTKRLDEILTDHLPAGWVEVLRAGRAGLILDQSTDGRGFRDSWMQIWHRQLKALGISPSRLVYVTQNRSFQDAYDRLPWVVAQSGCYLGGKDTKL